ncbi:MAG: hydroxymethylglutaryl-CoA synthase family protein [Chloroflexi bacterium]|nr:hydroxymethylglutaryl-CoA synthase family protein [Chloroflexota bacterium]
MAGISSFGAYIPWWRLGPETREWGSKAERAVASFDEDSITMAVAAATNCLASTGRERVDGLYYASTSSPYHDKQAAATIATALDLSPSASTADFTNSTRSGTIALRAALDAVRSGSLKNVLVVASDARPAMARSDFESAFGDAAAALLVSNEGAVRLEDWHTLNDEVLDVWRDDKERFLRSWEDRFVADEGYLRVLSAAAGALAKKRGIKPGDITKAALYAPDARRHAEIVRRLGLDAKTQVSDPLFSSVGNTGAAHALLVLINALEQAEGQEVIMLGSYGNGADVLLLAVAADIEKSRNGATVKAQIASRKAIDSYETYAKWRHLIDPAPPTRRPPLTGPSAAAYRREVDQNIRLHGAKCDDCGCIQYPPQRVCTRCHSKDKSTPVRFSGRKGYIYTYSMDYLGATSQPPLVIAVVNFEGGGRMLTQMTDRDPAAIKVGLPVEMTFRRLYSADGVHNYYWKSRSVRS